MSTAAHDDAKISRIRQYSSAALFIGACIFGLPVGATAGALYGLTAGVVGAAVFGLAGGALGLVCMDTIRRCMSKLQGSEQLHTLLDDELLQPDFQSALNELFEQERGLVSEKCSHWRSSILADVLRNVSNEMDTISLSSIQPVEESESHAGQHVRAQMASTKRLISRDEASVLLTSASERIRDPDYKLKEFHADMVKCFPGASTSMVV